MNDLENLENEEQLISMLENLQEQLEVTMQKNSEFHIQNSNLQEMNSKNFSEISILKNELQKKNEMIVSLNEQIEKLAKADLVLKENEKLIEKLSCVSECHDRALQENVQLKEETSELHQMLRGMQILHPYNIFRSMEEFPSNTDDLSFESFSESTGNYVDLLD